MDLKHIDFRKKDAFKLISEKLKYDISAEVQLLSIFAGREHPDESTSLPSSSSITDIV